MFKKTLMSLAIVLAPLTASASDFGTRAEAVEMVEKATAIFESSGLDAMIKNTMDTSNPDFTDRDLYVFGVDFEGTVFVQSALPALVGRNLIELKDPSGKKFVEDMIRIAKTTGSGWIDYYTTNPETQTIDAKSSWIQRVGDNHLIGVGVYSE